MPAKLIVDSGVGVKWVVSEPDSAQAEQIIAQYEADAVEFLAPALIHAEVGNIIWKKQIFQGLSANNADTAIKKFQQVLFLLTPTTTLFDDAYRITIAHKRSFYDSLYLALAERENCQFVTADERLYNAVRAGFPNIVLLADWK